jgi:hypothetical protein
MDCHDFTIGYEGSASVLLLSDRYSGLTWDYYLEHRTADSIIDCLKHFIHLWESTYRTKIQVFEVDNEFTTLKPKIKEFLESKHFKVEPSAPYTQAQNGFAERIGAIIKAKARAMRGRLPEELWPEIVRAAVYLYNRTPIRGKNWKSPYECFFETKPVNIHLRVYGCKSYAMTTKAKKKEERLHRLNPRAWIGYLVGYSSTNQYRIWVPFLNRVVITRDVIFDERIVFDGDSKTLEKELKALTLDDISNLVQKLSDDATLQRSTTTVFNDSLEEDEWDDSLGTEDEDQVFSEEPHESLKVGDLEGTSESQPAPQGPYTKARFELLPTPPDSPPSALMAAAFCSVEPSSGEKRDIQPWERKFLAGLSAVPTQPTSSGQARLTDRYRKQRHHAFFADTQMPTLTREQIRERLRQGIPIHIRELPSPPSPFHDYTNHPFREEFKEAELAHLASHAKSNTWDQVPTASISHNTQILDCMWVYTYKFDPNGYWIRCKARLVVRGDQQDHHYSGETYAATLAIRSFRMIATLAAHYDLEMIQYDAVNAFVNAELDEPVYMRMPHGHTIPGQTLLLKRAMYGLRKSPKLWQETFSNELKSHGFEPIPDEPCCLVKEGMIIFYYVDDFVLVFPHNLQHSAMSFTSKLMERFPLTGGDELHWFLGIEIIRDRDRRCLWLSQQTYIERIANLAESKTPCGTPMGVDHLLPFDGLATNNSIRRYQVKIGSLMYAAIITRPDIAYAVAQLARFMVNPGPKHHRAADRVLNYLRATSHLVLELGGGNSLEITSDASFADNLPDRKSTQAYTIRLFGGLVAWRSNKQDTVTTSTTEAELLALSQAARESMFVSRIMKGLSIPLANERIRIQCDNLQTIRLVTQELAKLQTQLRHVDIHNHWLRQEVFNGTIEVVYTPSKEILADGFTKPLQQNEFQLFRERLKVVARE